MKRWTDDNGRQGRDFDVPINEKTAMRAIRGWLLFISALVLVAGCFGLVEIIAWARGAA